VQETILGFLLLLLGVEESVECLAVESLSHSIPPQTSNRNLQILFGFDLDVTVFEGSVSTVQSNFEHRRRILIYGQSAKATPQLHIELQLDFLLFRGNPQIELVHSLLNQFSLAVLDQFQVREHLRGQDVYLARSFHLFDFDGSLAFCWGLCWGGFCALFTEPAHLLCNLSSNRIKSFS